MGGSDAIIGRIGCSRSSRYPSLQIPGDLAGGSLRMAAVRLTDLLPTNGYLLPYALSLLFISLVLNFSGAFLTLDRTRSFAPTGDVFKDARKSTSRLIASFFRGGSGGILTGFVFGSEFLLLPPTQQKPHYRSSFHHLPIPPHTKRHSIPTPETSLLPVRLATSIAGHIDRRRKVEVFCLYCLRVLWRVRLKSRR